jgi:hypothetical protein
MGILCWDKLDTIYILTSCNKSFSVLRFLIFLNGDSIVHVIRKVRVLSYVCRKRTGPPKSDGGNKKDDDKGDVLVKEFEEDTNDRYAA